ncbi:hypothetical protein B0T19DRAFT_415985 [Cercophora scortea]|uniref:Fungal N-terminal domain-containing protein n=1 Tax=Cercophora scortea TaxID=314031 RepID=A0AAE0IX49_9PEZI|nr:hypothetical protein B0T19DRAFT_415985 [Cercophora scortea]
MADPLTIIGTASAVSSLVGLIGKSISTIADIRSQWKSVDLTVLTFESQLASLNAALCKIEEWTTSITTDPHYQLVMDLDRSIYCCRLLMERIDRELSSLQRAEGNRLDVASKITLLFKTGGMKDVQNMIDLQTNALVLLLTACNCVSLSEQRTLLETPQTRTTLRRADDECLSMLVHRDDDSLQSYGTLTSIASSKRSIIFDFDQVLFSSSIYNRWIRGSVKKALRDQQGIPPKSTETHPSLAAFLPSSPAQIGEIGADALNRILRQGQMGIPVSLKRHLAARGQRAGRREWMEKTVIIGDAAISFQDQSTGLRLGLISRDVPPISLLNALASLVPDPGYSKTRPYVVSLSFLNGAVYLLETATYVAGKELVMAINYHCACITPPLQFPVVSGNAFDCLDIIYAAKGEEPEYGWNKKAQALFASCQSLDRNDVYDRELEAIRRMGDEMRLSEWYPHTQPLYEIWDVNRSASKLAQDLKLTVERLGTTMQGHNAVRANMQMIFTVGGRAEKTAVANWKMKSSYLLREYVKYSTYLSVLEQVCEWQRELVENGEGSGSNSAGEEDQRRMPVAPKVLADFSGRSTTTDVG